MKHQHNKPKCGLCGSAKKKLTKTVCCENWICDDVDTYVIFSYERNSCYRNHDRYTLCAYHSHESHTGRWQDCKKCKDNFDLPNYVSLGKNEYNFEILENPEKVTITCVNCNFTTDTLDEFAYQTSKGYYCQNEKCQKSALNQTQTH
jgi:hypothetical protein